MDIVERLREFVKLEYVEWYVDVMINGEVQW